jgi:hypothetical protein
MNYVEGVYILNRRKIQIIFLFAFIFASVTGQELQPGMQRVPGQGNQASQDEPPPLRQRIFFGGEFSLAFGTITNIQIAPIIGYWLLPSLAIAGGPSYTYYKDPYVQTSLYGGRIYTDYLLFRDLDKFIPAGIHLGLLLHAEDEMLNLDPYEYGTSNVNTGRQTVNTILVGGGINQPMGGRASFNIMILWALTSSPYYNYNNPVFRIGFQF